MAIGALNTSSASATGSATALVRADPVLAPSRRNAEAQAGAEQSRTGAATRPETSATRLTPEEQRTVDRLQARDREVRTHEQAHLAAAGSLATGGPTYSFQRGPDGRLYAVGGEVQIDTSAGRTPEETLERAQRIRAAALAPAEPSAQDRAVAAEAAALAAQARQELAQQRREDDQRQQPGVGQSPPAGSLIDLFA